MPFQVIGSIFSLQHILKGEFKPFELSRVRTLLVGWMQMLRDTEQLVQILSQQTNKKAK